MTEFAYHDMFPLGTDTTTYRRLDGDGLIRSGSMDGEPVVRIDREAIRLLTAEAIRDISHLFRTPHLQQLRKILDDHDASANDHFVARTLLQNAAISSGMVVGPCGSVWSIQRTGGAWCSRACEGHRTVTNRVPPTRLELALRRF